MRMIYMKKIVIISIYSVSLILVLISLNTIFQEERLDQLEYNLTEEKIDIDIDELVHSSNDSMRNQNYAVIYFVEPQICPPCMTEISEFYNLFNQYLENKSGVQIIVINSESINEVEEFIKFLNVDIKYRFDPEEETYRFLSKYQLRELVGQLVFVDLQNQVVKARVILEESLPTEYAVKEEIVTYLI